MFNIGDRVRYTGNGPIYMRMHIGRFATVIDQEVASPSREGSRIRWEIDGKEYFSMNINLELVLEQNYDDSWE